MSINETITKACWACVRKLCEGMPKIVLKGFEHGMNL
jgi:hypothetical protein